MSCVAFFIAMFEVKNSLILRTEELGWTALQLKLNIYICIYIYMGKVNAMSFN